MLLRLNTAPQQPPLNQSDGFTFYRSAKPLGLFAKLPFLNQWAIVLSLAKRLDEIIPEIKPDILHAHSPALNGLAALKVAKKYKIPLVYECRAFWEDAAVDHGTSTEGGLRYYLTKMLETYVFKQADAITTICEGLRSDIVSRGIPAEKITVIPNAVDIERFTYGVEPDQAVKNPIGLTEQNSSWFYRFFLCLRRLAAVAGSIANDTGKKPETRLLLVGGGPQEALIKQKTKELGLEAAGYLYWPHTS